MKKNLLWALLCAVTLLNAQDTFSIVAVDPNTGEIGSAGASCLDNIGFPGSNGAIIISDIIPGRGAIHTQSYWNATNQANARLKMEQGLSPAEIITWLKANDVAGVIGSANRQYGIVDFDTQGQPRSAAHTGNGCLDWKGHRIGANYSIQGNILLGPQILDSMEARFLQMEGEPLANRLMFALQGANVVGADTRCTANGTSSLSAFIRMAIPSDTLGSLYLDLNVPSLPAGQEPIDSLQTLFDAWAAVRTVDIPQEDIQVFPNPASQSFSFIWNQSGDYFLEITDINGVLVHRTTIIQGFNQVHKVLPAGMYLLKILNTDAAVHRTGKIIIAPK